MKVSSGLKGAEGEGEIAASTASAASPAAAAAATSSSETSARAYTHLWYSDPLEMLSSFTFSGLEKAGCDAARARAAKVASEEEGVVDDGGPLAIEFRRLEASCERHVRHEPWSSVPGSERVDQALRAVAGGGALRRDEPEGVGRGR